jgi:negative regulator of flagellin synthesis FlgM
MQVPDKIRGINATDATAPIKGSSGSATAPDKTQSAPVATVGPAADQVTLTGSARLLQKLSDAVASVPVVNPAKVSAVKQAVQNGSYKVDAGRVADKLLNFERGLE